MSVCGALPVVVPGAHWADLAFKKVVTVRPFGKDRYGRTLADVVLPDDRVLNRELLAARFAWHYTRYSNDRTLAKLERQARDAGAGIWSEARSVGSSRPEEGRPRGPRRQLTKRSANRASVPRMRSSRRATTSAAIAGGTSP